MNKVAPPPLHVRVPAFALCGVMGYLGTRFIVPLMTRMTISPVVGGAYIITQLVLHSGHYLIENKRCKQVIHVAAPFFVALIISGITGHSLSLGGIVAVNISAILAGVATFVAYMTLIPATIMGITLAVLAGAGIAIAMVALAIATIAVPLVIGASICGISIAILLIFKEHCMS